MKLLLLTYEYPPFHGGVAAYLSNLMKAAPSGVEVIVEVPPKGEYWMKTAWRQFFKIRKNKPDLIAISHVLPVGYIAFKIEFWFKIPYLVFTHGTDILTARKNAWKRFWMRFILRRAKLVIANSRFTAGLLREEGIISVEIVPPGLKTKIQQLTTKIQKPTIISVGRLVPRKGFDTLIRAMPAVLKEIPDAHLTIIGQGPYHEELIRIAYELHVENFVEIITNADDTAREERLRSSSLFVLAARRENNDIEGFGIVTLEASAAGLPVVVTDSGGAAEPVVNGVTGIIVKEGDTDALSTAMIRLLKNSDEARKMGEDGRKYVTEQCSIEKIGKRFWNLVLNHNSPYPPLS